MSPTPSLQLFTEIARVQPSLKGWCRSDKAITLASIVCALRPLVSVEIGVYGGSSLIPTAMAHKHVGVGMVYGIDPWDRDAAVEAQTTPEDKEWWYNERLDLRYQEVNDAILALGLQDFVTLIRKRSIHAEVPGRISLLHVDGGHNDMAVTDVVRFAPQVEIGGFCICDDLNWKGGGVTRAVQRLLQLGFKQLYPLD